MMAEAILGQDAEEFMRSDVGRYILGRAQQEAQEAMDKLKTTSAWRRRRITQLQSEIWRAESIQGWVIELINNGLSSERALDQSRIESE